MTDSIKLKRPAGWGLGSVHKTEWSDCPDRARQQLLGFSGSQEPRWTGCGSRRKEFDPPTHIVSHFKNAVVHCEMDLPGTGTVGLPRDPWRSRNMIPSSARSRRRSPRGSLAPSFRLSTNASGEPIDIPAEYLRTCEVPESGRATPNRRPGAISMNAKKAPSLVAAMAVYLECKHSNLSWRPAEALCAVETPICRGSWSGGSHNPMRRSPTRGLRFLKPQLSHIAHTVTGGPTGPGSLRNTCSCHVLPGIMSRSTSVPTPLRICP